MIILKNNTIWTYRILNICIAHRASHHALAHILTHAASPFHHQHDYTTRDDRSDFVSHVRIMGIIRGEKANQLPANL